MTCWRVMGGLEASGWWLGGAYGAAGIEVGIGIEDRGGA